MNPRVVVMSSPSVIGAQTIGKAGLYLQVSARREAVFEVEGGGWKMHI
jgi:hypothetical protein